MEVEVKAEAKDRRLNSLIALTIVILSVFMALSKIKDDNIVQAMQQAKADAVDTWGEYQATKIKLHIDENALNQTRLLASAGARSDRAVLDPQVTALSADLAKYRAIVTKLQDKAHGFDATYDALNVHDDQFDMSDALVSIAISAAAVAALVETFYLLVLAWVAGGFGMLLGIAGFAGWALHPDFLARALG